MFRALPCLIGAAFLALTGPVNGFAVRSSAVDSVAKACQLLQQSFPNSISYPGSAQFAVDIKHWANSSSQVSTCSVEPETADDVAGILRIVGREDVRSPFAVKGGGHAFNVGYSSTTGVQISMAKFSELSYDPEGNTVTVGTGLTWDQVYSQLEPYGVMVTGGRINGVGVAGLTLGGGFSWKTNQFGLTIDTVVSYNVVLPTGEQVFVSNTSYPDLFFGLKGGLNNFGIVTNITLEAHPQTEVFGGGISYAPNVTDAVNAAISDFSLNNTDLKAQILVSYASVGGQFGTSIVFFYDGPSPPSGVFDAFFSIPNVGASTKTRSFVDFMSTFGADGDLGIGPFGLAAHVIPITHYPIALLDEMVQQTTALGETLTASSNGSTVFLTMTPEPFTNPFAHSRGGAYPHSPSRQVTPATPQVAYQFNSSLDAATQAAIHDSFFSAIKEFAYNIQAKAVEEGVSSWDDILYPNYAMAGTPLESMFGSNVDTLKKLSSKYDPDKVMNLTGGFHFF